MRNQLTRSSGTLFGAVACAALALCCSMHAQTTAAGTVVSPATQGARPNSTTPPNCTGQEPNSAAGVVADANCVAAGPGFVTPSANMPNGRNSYLTSLVRVDAVVPRPPVTLPDGDSFSVVGTVTLLKLRRPEVGACLATGRRISARAGAPTSTTCLDPKGEVMAYQECRANSTEQAGCTVMTMQDIQKQQVAAKQP